MLPSFIRGLTAAAFVSLAAVLPAAAQTVANFSFETPATTSNSYSTINGWTASNDVSGNGLNGGYGLNNVNGAFANNGIIPNGNQVAFLQTSGTEVTTLTQTISGLTIGNQYMVSFYDNSRQYGDNPVLNVSFGGQAITAPQTIAPVGGSNPYNFITSSPYTATGTSADLVFSVSIGSLGDATALIDNVTINGSGSPVPEASTTASLGLLLMLGLGGAVITARKKARG